MVIAPEVKIGDIFSRIDKNGNEWIAEVINRTDCFVDVKKYCPYKVKVANSDISGQFGCYHWEDSEPVTERSLINKEIIPIKTGKMARNIFGKEVEEVQYLSSGKCFIMLKDYKNDNPYYLKKD